jgi:hypothetical protein
MFSRLTDLLPGAVWAAFSLSSLGAAVGHMALFAYAGVGGFLLGIFGQCTPAHLKRQRQYYEPVLNARWNGVLMVTNIIFGSLVLLRLTLDFRVPEPVYGIGAAALALSTASQLLPVFLRPRNPPPNVR